MLTGVLSEFVAGSRPSDLSASVKATAKRGVLDCLGVTLAGSLEDVSGIVTGRVRDIGARGGASVIRGGFKTSAHLAAYANGTLGHALDYDDVLHIGTAWIGHPSVVILPAVMAVAEETGATGGQMLHAYCLGIELYAHIGMFCSLEPYAMGWHNTCYLGTLASAGAVAGLLGLDAGGVRRSLGIAGSLAGGLRQNFGTMTKPLHAGISARNGVEAAMLAKAGLTADETILEAPMGVRSVFNAKRTDLSKGVPYGEDLISPEAFAARLGAPWMIENPSLAFKICPSCRGTHFGMDAALNFLKAHPGGAGRLVQVDAHMPSQLASMLFYHAPKTGLEGKFSMEYVLARTLLGGRPPKIGDFADERVTDPEVKALIGKINWISFETRPGIYGEPEFVFRLDDGREYRTKVAYPLGEPENPVSDEVLIGKFDDCAGEVLAKDARDRLRDLVLDLDTLDEFGELMGLLRRA